MTLSIGLLAVGLVSFLSGAVEAQNGKCSGQSCYVASLGLTTPEPYALKGGKKPTGGNASGDVCIKNVYKSLGLAPPPGLKFIDLQKEILRKRELNLKDDALIRTVPDLGNVDAFYSEVAKRQPRQLQEEEEHTSTIESRQACKANTLVFARGTTEIGDFGGTVGPSLKNALGGWYAEGVKYSADLPGIKCLGLPGGQKCVSQVNKIVAKCPQTNIILSGYSQGAMVARFCAVWANPEARARVKGIMTFGDPFNGAEVKGIPNKNVRVFCNTGDGVCGGALSITPAHLSYGGDIAKAAAWAKGQVGKA